MKKHVFLPIFLASILSACGGGSTPPAPSTGSQMVFSTVLRVASPTPNPTPHHQKLYVVDQGESSVAAYQLDGTPTTPRFPLPTNSLPCSIAVDWSERVYVGDQLSGNVFVYDSTGTQVKTLTGFKTPCALAVRNQTLYVADITTGQILQYALPSYVVSQTVISDYGPMSIAIDNSGDMYVGDVNPVKPWGGRVTIFSPNGTVLSTLANITSPLVMAIDSKNNIYVGDTYQESRTKITKFSSDGTQLNPTITLYNPGPWGLAVDASGRIYASQGEDLPHKQRIVQYDKSGVVINKSIASDLANPGPIAIL